RRPPAGDGRGSRELRADRLQDLPPQERRAAPRRRPALALRACRTRGLAARVLAPGLLLRARRRDRARALRGPRPRRGQGPGPRGGEGILAQDFEPTPSPAACSICDYRIVCP